MENALTMYYVIGGASLVAFILGAKLILARILKKLMVAPAESP